MSDSSYIEILKFDTAIIDSDKRIAKGWGSSDVRDLQGQLIPMEELKKTIPTYLRRGGTISLEHTSKHVGRVLSIDWDIHPIRKTLAPIVTYEIFSDYSIDNETWERIQKGELGALSLGGRALKNEVVCDKDTCTQILKNIELWEWAVVGRGANQDATKIATSLAKGYPEVIIYDFDKKIIDFRKKIASFKGEIDSSTCPTCIEFKKEILKHSLTSDQADSIIKSLVERRHMPEEKTKEIKKDDAPAETATGPAPPGPSQAEEAPQEEEDDGLTSIEELLEAMATRLEILQSTVESIEAKISSSAVNAPPAPVEKPKEVPPEKPAEKPEEKADEEEESEDDPEDPEKKKKKKKTEIKKEVTEMTDAVDIKKEAVELMKTEFVEFQKAFVTELKKELGSVVQTIVEVEVKKALASMGTPATSPKAEDSKAKEVAGNKDIQKAAEPNVQTSKTTISVMELAKKYDFNQLHDMLDVNQEE